jgi:cbb3-type cytochrome oxidase maturation protein
MNALLLLIPLSLLLLVGAGMVFFRAVDAGQFEDMETPRLLPLLDVDARSVPDDAGADAHGASTDAAMPHGRASIARSDA